MYVYTHPLNYTYNYTYRDLPKYIFNFMEFIDSLKLLSRLLVKKKKKKDLLSCSRD